VNRLGVGQDSLIPTPTSRGKVRFADDTRIATGMAGWRQKRTLRMSAFGAGANAKDRP
jgi:hypothetical protein